MKGFLFLLPWFAAVLACGGESPCVKGESFCDEDGFARTCEDEQENADETVWYVQRCGEGDEPPACVVGALSAFCALSDEPVDACPGATPSTHVCDGTDEVTCTGPYAVARESCTTCTPDPVIADGVDCVH